MAKVGAQRAAELTGRSKSTIQRAMNSGKISYELDSNGRRVIDVSELDRAFGLRAQGSEAPSSNAVETELKKAADLLEMERMKMRIKMLEDQLDTTKDQLDDLKEQRDQWQRQAQQVLLTSQYSQKQAEGLQAELKERERKEQERERREQERRRQMMESRMKKVQGDNQNHTQSRPITRPVGGAQTTGTEADRTEGSSVQNLWQKIKGVASAG